MSRPIARRGWVRAAGGWERHYANRAARRLPRRYGVTEVLAFDTETRTDFAQRFMLGVWRITVDGICVEEGILVADDLGAVERAVVDDYVVAHEADVAPGHARRLVVMGLRQWVNARLYTYAVARKATVVGANLPFDLAALARYSSPARAGRRHSLYSGGWSLALWGRPDAEGGWIENGRPRVLVRRLSRHAAFIGFGASEDDRRRGTRPETGRFVDLLTVAYALSGRPHSLESACAAFDVSCSKVAVDFGQLTPALLDHCRADVAPLVPLYEAMSATTTALSGVEGDVAGLYSPATVVGRLLSATGLRAPLDAHADTVGDEVLGIACAASYAGRIEARIVRTDVPVAVLDWSSQYPCVAALCKLWDHWRADRVTVVDVTGEVVEWLGGDGTGECFDPATWARLGVTFVQLVPDGDELPHRVHEGGRWVLRFGPLRSTDDPGWWSWADVAASVVLTGRVPNVTTAVRLVPNGVQPDLAPVHLSDGSAVDPATEDLFAALVSARARATSGGDERAALLAKVMVNALAHGLPGQLNEKAKGAKTPLLCWAGAAPFVTSTDRIEEPGRWYWPPIAATVTAGGRLLLALAQRMVTDAGGAWTYCSTDSLAIVATGDGGPVDVEGGPVTALSWPQVEAIRQRFVALNPFGDVSPWKVEADSLATPTTAWVGRAGSYLLLQQGPDGEAVVGGAEAGMGDRYLDPLPGAPGLGRLRAWSIETLLWARGQVAALAEGREPVPQPAFMDLPALRSQVAGSPRTPGAGHARPLAFWLEATARAGPARPAAPFSRDLAAWESWPWIDLGDGRPTTVATSAAERISAGLDPAGAVVATLGHVGARLVLNPGALGLSKGRRRGIVDSPAMTEVSGVVVVGKESAGVDDPETGPDGTGVATRQAIYNRLCACGCGRSLGATGRKWATDACRKRASRAKVSTDEPPALCALLTCEKGPDGEPAPASPRGFYCSNACRQAAYRDRKS